MRPKHKWKDSIKMDLDVIGVKTELTASAMRIC
jgi:hypothetical protein